jgi:hypothetical protein
MKFTSTPLYLVIVAFVVGCCFTACNDDSDDVKGPDELIVGTWQRTEVWNAGVNEFENYEPCRKDDLFKFKENNTFSFEEGPTKCDSAEAQVFETGTYELLNEGTEIRLEGSGFSGDTLQILELKSSRLVISEVGVPDMRTVFAPAE